ncbi:ComEC/Rec2 family competence protein [Aestuariivirga litoralis]|uniref:ComEC/Rec2 family competence protein n=1 Tax=Aestuariivirga litoralis TaxID=2650924 RepID=UPI0018C7EAB5|nr:ComEC/Rec2 family competence protein [Aestuariivirga litoralis]
MKGQAISWEMVSVWAWAQVNAAVTATKAQADRLLLWAPLFLITGNWIYFTLPTEPAATLNAVFATAAMLLLLLRRKSLLFFLMGLVLVGFCATKFRADMVATPMLRGSTNGVIIGGYVADYENKAKGARQLTVTVEEQTGIPEDEQPRRVRVYAQDAAALQIGDYISFEAYLSPLPRPVQPGGFDYGRMLYFESIGAGGRMIGAPSLEMRPVPWQFEYRRIFRTLRTAISDRITSVIPGPVGHLADSMVSGERSGIPQEMNQSLQISGLAHIISISGLHMSMVAGGVFWAVRALLALIPFLALRFPIKKIAAVAALIVGLIYTLLADSGSATERSYLMIAVMFCAILVDRRAISLRNLAIAAILILLVTPEESVGASFQMSFLAVMGLAGLAEWWHSRPRREGLPDASRSMRLVSKAGRAVMAAALTTLIAGSASTIAAAYHFDRLSPYGILANGLTLPVTELLVMPPALVAVILMPFGFEYYPLKVMEFGLTLTMQVSDWIASWPSANVLVAKPHVAGILLLAFAAAILAIGGKGLRLPAILLAALGFSIASIHDRPVILVEDRTANVAILDQDDHYVLASNVNKFVATKWLLGNGDTASVDQATQRQGWDCNTGDCFSTLAPMSVSYLQEKSGNGLYCPNTQIIIADFPLRHQCKARLVIDRFDVWRNGAYAVSFKNGRYSLRTAREEQGQRPWAHDSRKSIRN